MPVCTNLTRKPEHKDILLTFNHEHILDPLAQGDDQLDRLHANTQIPKAIGAARQYEVTGDIRSRQIAEFFWQRVALARSYVTGGHSDDELFFPVDRFSQHLSTKTAETYNMLKLTRYLFSRNAPEVRVTRDWIIWQCEIGALLSAPS